MALICTYNELLDQKRKVNAAVAKQLAELSDYSWDGVAVNHDCDCGAEINDCNTAPMSCMSTSSDLLTNLHADFMEGRPNNKDVLRSEEHTSELQSR